MLQVQVDSQGSEHTNLPSLCLVQAHPRRVAKVASQIQREVSEMFIYDKVGSSIYGHAPSSSCKHTSLSGWHTPHSNCAFTNSQGQLTASSCGCKHGLQHSRTLGWSQQP
jgi:hypothetical protein